MATYTKRPGFAREEVLDINDIVYTDPDTGEEVGRVSVEGATFDSLGNLHVTSTPDLTQAAVLGSILYQLQLQNGLLAEAFNLDTDMVDTETNANQELD